MNSETKRYATVGGQPSTARLRSRTLRVFRGYKVDARGHCVVAAGVQQDAVIVDRAIRRNAHSLYLGVKGTQECVAPSPSFWPPSFPERLQMGGECQRSIFGVCKRNCRHLMHHPWGRPEARQYPPRRVAGSHQGAGSSVRRRLFLTTPPADGQRDCARFPNLRMRVQSSSGLGFRGRP